MTTTLDASGQPYFPDLVSFVPGVDEEPHVLYRNPDRTAWIWNVAVRNGHYAFVELSNQAPGAGWRLWALPGPNRPAVLLEQSDLRKEAPSPAIEITDDRVIWNVTAMKGQTEYFELRSARFDGSDRRVLASSPTAVRQYWYPSVDPSGIHLLYSTVEPLGSGYRFRIFSLDLTDPKAEPVRLGDSDEATEPLTNGNVLVWRVVDGNVNNRGKGLMVAGADGANPHPIPVQSVMYLSLGTRFLAYDSTQSPDLALYDTQASRVVVLERHEPPDQWGLQKGWTVVAGNLLVFRRVKMTDDGSFQTPQVCWAILPFGG